MTSARRRGRLPEALVVFSLAKPGLVVAAWLALAGVAAVGAASLKIETTVDSVLDRTGDDWKFYQDSQRIFGGDEVVVLMISSDVPFDPARLERVAELSWQLESIPGVRRVDSVATVPAFAVDASGELVVEPSLTKRRLATPEGVAAIRALVSQDRDATGLLVSEDGRSFALNIVLEQGAYGRSAQILEAIAANAGEQAVWSGVPVFRNETNKRTERELLSLVPVTAVLIFLLLLTIFRSWLFAVLPLVTSAISVLVVVGTMGALEVSMTISTLILPTILLALGCAYSMHMLCAASSSDMGSGPPLNRRVRPVALPVALSGLTTAIGFLAISTVRIGALRQVGGFGGFGALVATVAVLTMLPALLSLAGTVSESRSQVRLRGPATDLIVGWVGRGRWVFVCAFGTACVVALAGLGRLRVESDVIEWFPQSDPLRVSYSEIRDRLSGISPVNVLVQAAEGETVAMPDVIAALSRFAEHLESLPSVGKAISVATSIERVHSALGRDSVQLSELDRATIDQYLLVLSTADHVHDLISLDRTVANVWIRANNNGSQHLLEVAREAERWWGVNGSRGTTARSTGIMFEFARAQRAISMGQITGLGLALAAITVVLYLAFGSFSIALLALLPNIVPVLISFGILAWLRVPLDAGTVLVGNLALGIAVDDTIHLVSALRESGEGDFRSSLSGALRQVLPPLVFTTVVLAAGFAVLGVSSFVFIRNLGLLTALILVVCLAADLLLLPSALLLAEEATGKAYLKAPP